METTHLPKKLPLLYLFLITIFVSIRTPAFAAEPSLEELAQTTTWKKLLHIRPAAGLWDKNHSTEVVSKEFFVSKTQDPIQEISATLQGIESTEGLDNDSHAQCKFPARALWLAHQLPEKARHWPRASCLAYRTWRGEELAPSLSLIYATGYFENPASYYGHLLLKINQLNNLSNKGLLDSAINYGAALQGDDFLLTYIFKGIFGGYEGAFSKNTFYTNRYNYGNTEQRDLWEYKLNLPEAQSNLLIAHLWELQQIKFRYYFFKKNCAYRIAEALELISDKPINRQKIPWAVPISTFQKISGNNPDSFESVTYLPSQQSRLKLKFSTAPSATRKALIKLASTENPLASAAYASLSEQEQILARSLLVDHAALLIQQNDGAEEFKKRKAALLQEQARQKDKPLSIDYQKLRPKPPHTTLKPSLVSITNSSRREETSQRLRIRPAYFDQLDSIQGVMPFAELSMFDTQIDFYNGNAALHQLDFFKIVNLKLAASDLTGSQGLAWAVRSGIEQAFQGCRSCLTPFIEGGLGKATQPANNLALWGLLNARVEKSRDQRSSVSWGPSVHATLHLGETLSIASYLSERRYIQGGPTETLGAFEGRLQVAPNADIRLGFHKTPAREVRVTASYYW